MIAINNFKVFDQVTSPQESPISGNVTGDTLVVQVSGAATGLNLVLLGQVDIQGDTWVPLAAINMTDFSIGSAITKKGIYSFSLDGIGRYKFNLTSVSGGAIDVFYRVTKGV